MENEEIIHSQQPESGFEEPPVREPVIPTPLPEAPFFWTADNLPPVEKKPRKKGGAKRFWKRFAVCVIIIGLIAGGCGITAVLVNNRVIHQTNAAFADLRQQIADLKEEIQSNSFTGNGNSISGTGNADGLTPGQIYAQYQDTVVAISNQVTTNIFGQVTETASSGSGFIISQDGYIVTNCHVVEGATKLTVITSNGTEYDAALIGYDESNDIALLKVDATGLPVAKLGSSDDLIVGDQVVAIGNPLGELTNSLTVGYISAKDRTVTTEGTLINMLQTDAAINPGNSGGPLFNMKGEVIGITTAKYSGTTDSGASIEGIGFAIPMDDVVGMFQELMEKGYISAPYMGISVTTQADGFGVYVRSVETGGPAATAGLRPGDIVVGLGDIDVKSLQDLDKALREFKAFETTSVFVYRNRTVLELTITFAEKNQPAATNPAN